MRQWLKVVIVSALAALLILVLVPAGCAAPEEEETAAEFYQGKTIDWYICTKPGGGFDTVSRAFVPYLEKYTGATVVPINKPGGQLMLAPIHVYSGVQPDGLSMSIVHTQTAILAQLLDRPGMENVDLTNFNWLVNLATSPTVLFVNPDLPYKTLADIKTAKQFRIPVTGSTAQVVGQLILREALGVQGVKTILGYESSGEVALAVARGEFDSSALPVRTVLKYAQDGSLRPILVVSKDRAKDMPDVPTIYEAIEQGNLELSADGKAWIDTVVAMNDLYRTMVTTPGVPQDRLDFLREAFKNCFQEQELLAAGEKGKMNLRYTGGAEAAKAISSFLKVTPERKARFKELMQ